MRYKKIFKRLLVFSITLSFLLSILYIRTSFILPQRILLLQDKEYTYNFNTPLNLEVTADKQDSIKLNGSKLKSDAKLNLKSPITIQSSELGKINLNLTLFGRIPLRTLTVNVIPSTMVVPCGKTIGVKIYTKGILVVGTSKVIGIDGKEYRPYKNSDIREGDTILKINNKKISKISELSDEVMNSQGNPISIQIQKNGVIKNEKITPIKSLDDGKYKIGLWVRDSTSGIGTLTFYNPQSKTFGALGHGIMDVDTGTLLSVNTGEIIESSILSVNKGTKGNPGELKGIFIEDGVPKGNIADNNKFGIYGTISNIENLPNNSPLPVGMRNEITVGPATILSNVSGKEVESYSIEIQKIMYNNYSDSKSMVIKITDPKLIQKTGGIVQGMSGSPIIQKGKLVGAVTHVFINDATRGYGVFSDMMLDSMNNISKK